MERSAIEKALTDLTNALAAEQDKNKILEEQKAELVKALEAAAFDLRIRKQMKENLTPMQLSILEKAEQSLEIHVK